MSLKIEEMSEKEKDPPIATARFPLTTIAF